MGVAVYYLLTYVLAFLLIGGFLWSVWNLVGITAIARRRSLRAQVGGFLESHLELRNNSRFPKGWLMVNEAGDLPGHAVARLVGVSRGSGYAGRIRTPCTRRGLFTVGPLQVESWDPLGLFRLRRRFGQEEQVVVYPATVPLTRLNLFGSHLLGEEALRRQSQHRSALASSVREYTYGDAMNRIHWPSTARMGKVMVKQFDQGLSTSIWVLLDMEEEVQVGQDGDSSDELGVTIAASIAQRYLSSDIPVGLSAHGDKHHLVPPSTSPNHLQRILESLALVKAEGQVPLAEGLGQIGPYLNRYSTLLVVTPSVKDDWPVSIAPLFDRGVSVVAVIIDPKSYGVAVDASSMKDGISSLAVPTISVARGQPLEEALALPVRGAPFPHHIPEVLRR
jgi:uncharacterized protein (DUF58 family)